MNENLIFPTNVDTPQGELLENITKILLDYRKESHPDTNTVRWAIAILRLVDRHFRTYTW